MELSPFFFYLFAGLAIGCALMVVFKKNPVTSAFALIMMFFCFAAIYAMLDAHLIAALQVLVYAGAIMVLFIFVIMLLNADTPVLDFGRSHLGVKLLAAVVGLGLVGMFSWVFKNSPIATPTGKFSPVAVEAAGGNTRVLSEVLFSDYILPFELTSVLLLGAIVGAVAIAKRKPAAGHMAAQKGRG